MSKPAKPAKAAAAPADGAAPPAKSKKMLIIIIAVVVLALAGGAGWYFTKGKAAASEHKEEAKPVVVEPKFVHLGERFTVNLVHEEGDQYLQAGITLKILDPLLEEKIKATMPEIRSKLLFILSSKKPSEISTVQGKRVLVAQIITSIDKILGVGAEHAEHEDEGDAHAASGVAAAGEQGDAPAHGEAAPHAEADAHAAPAAHAEAGAHGEAEAPADGHAPAAEASAVVAAPVVEAGKKKTGIVDVLFSDFIIQ